ncbi:hypothetical protein PSTEL_09520 [Paenibacillus stellifer]|uniref:Uncharacterized protein n=1 Tax=Paenibacillus stellifer TaxID=169760 RepID=A0A089LVN5_9BACL|nr:hypothetical protein [Paenibacillus stellifer]AIQ63293.1 hypothetical protein PSTEL_09520 [Paenibacillus stellifer]
MSLSIVPNHQPSTIQADIITIIAKDPNTGITAERQLPVKFRENQFGVWLEGTDEFGDSQAIVIFTSAGTNRMEELLGQADISRENEESAAL